MKNELKGVLLDWFHGKASRENVEQAVEKGLGVEPKLLADYFHGRRTHEGVKGALEQDEANNTFPTK